MNSCPPCHGECNYGKLCPAESHPAYDAWADYYKSLQIDIKATRFMFARSWDGIVWADKLGLFVAVANDSSSNT